METGTKDSRVHHALTKCEAMAFEEMLLADVDAAWVNHSLTPWEVVLSTYGATKLLVIVACSAGRNYRLAFPPDY